MRASESDPSTPTGFVGVVALDGPSGTGKSTVARGLARRLGLGYLDTGAMYRAITWAVLLDGVDPADATAVAATVDRHVVGISTDPDHPAVFLDGQSVDAEIRSPAVTAAVSAVSSVAQVRQAMVAQQRALITAIPAVAEGRDIAAVVWPQAELKVYLTASEEVRARRRAGELPGTDQTAVAADLRRRDRLDSSRAVSPFRRADAAIEVDTSELDIDEVIDTLAALALDSVATVDAAHGS